MSLCVIYGPVASGKLTTAQEFAKQTGWKVFHNHLIQDILVDLLPYEREDLRPQRAALSRTIRKDILKVILAADINVVMTMNYGGSGGKDMLGFIVEQAQAHNTDLYIVRLHPDRAELDKRVVGESRKAYAKADTPEILARLLDGEGYGYEKFPDIEHLEIDNTEGTVGDTVHKIMAHYHISAAAEGGSDETTN